MPRVIVRGPEERSETVLEVDDERVFLVGRKPTASDPPPAALEGRRVELTTVPGISVSQNHLAAWSVEGVLQIRDSSRNGTWALLPKGQTIPIAGSEVVLQLAQGVSDAVTAEDPKPPIWTTGAEYARSMADSIERWLAARGLDIVPTLTMRSDRTQSFPARMPLASGHALELTPSGTTMDDRWRRLFERLWAWVERQNGIYDSEESTRREGVILASSAIRAAHSAVVAVARRGAFTLLLTGETGAGKERLAEVFHRHTGRNGPLITVNCSSFDKELIRQELFGSEKGAFTGASRRIAGAVERAQGGTLFLDEMGEIPLDLQGLLLRFLDNREIATIGRWGEKIRADVRVVAATHRALRDDVLTGTFREDLWYRLAVNEVEVPPLRERWEDITRFLENERDEKGRSILQALSPQALDVLRGHNWKGNFRELRGLAERLLAAGLPDSISEAVCRREVSRGSPYGVSPSVPPPGPTRDVGPSDWTSIMGRAISAFVEDHGHEPSRWADQREWNERYLKPLVFYHMSGASAFAAPADEEALRGLAGKMAVRIQADRATAFTQLQRYFQRFHG